MTAIDRAMLNQGHPGNTWSNLGLWAQAQDYPAACEAMAMKLAKAAQYARLAKLCCIPPENLLTQTAYSQALSDMGFNAVRLEPLDDEVLSGFVRFATRLLRHKPLSALSPGGLKVLVTAAIIRWLQRGPQAHYVIVTARHPG